MTSLCGHYCHTNIHAAVPLFGNAVVFILATSDPLPTSLTPIQARISPAIEGARNVFFNSSLPKRDSAGVAISERGYN